MHEQLEKIKSLEGSPKIIKNFLNSDEVNLFLKLYNNLPITVHNLKQKVIKKDGFLDLVRNWKKF